MSNERESRYTEALINVQWHRITADAVARAVMAVADAEQDEMRRKVEAWIRHGESVPSDVTTYERWIVHQELRALLGLDA